MDAKHQVVLKNQLAEAGWYLPEQPQSLGSGGGGAVFRVYRYPQLDRLAHSFMVANDLEKARALVPQVIDRSWVNRTSETS